MKLELLPPPDGSAAPPEAPGLTRAGDVLDALRAHRGGRHEAHGAVPTDVPAFDDVGGLRLGTLTAVVAPPGTRPTWLLLQAALHAAGRERPTLFCALDMTPVAFAVGLGRLLADGGNDVDDEAALEAAARRLADLPLYVEVGGSLSTHDIFLLAEEALVDFVVVDNYRLLVPAGSAVDLKHCATDLNVAALASAVHPGADDALGARDLAPDLLDAAETVACCDRTGRHCRVVLTRA